MKIQAFTLYQPPHRESAVVFSSPHSGRVYSEAFLAASVLDSLTLRSSEDAFVELLFDAAPQYGAPLIAASAPRAYVDLNRAVDELDPAVIEGAARSPHNPRVASGLGVIPRVVSGGRAIYRGKLPLSEAESRINTHWQPYHRALRRLLDESHHKFGHAVLIDCHSMPHEAIANHGRSGGAQPDVVLGDRFGSAASAEVVAVVERAFRDSGLRVARNAPFAGAYITQAYGRPSRGYHAVQVEIDRRLYMNEAAVTKNENFEAVKALITQVIAKVSRIGHDGLGLAAE